MVSRWSAVEDCHTLFRNLPLFFRIRKPLLNKSERRGVLSVSHESSINTGLEKQEAVGKQKLQFINITSLVQMLF